MWQAYEQLPKATLVGCWAHVRRKFHEAVPQQASGKVPCPKRTQLLQSHVLLRTKPGRI